jgi:hypothetical protein
VLRQNLVILLDSPPEPLAVFSLHHYGSPAPMNPEENQGVSDSLEALRCRVRAIQAARSPVFVGELGNTEPALRDDHDAVYVRSAIDLVEAEGVSLAAVWAWHLRLDSTHCVTADSHPALLKRIAEFNEKHAGER